MNLPYEKLKSDVLCCTKITANQKRIISFIREHSDIPLAGSYIAAGLGLSRSVVTSGIAKLEQLRFIERTGRSRQGISYRFIMKQFSLRKFYLLLYCPPRGLSSSEMILLEYLKYRCNDSPQAWPRQSTIAQDLGYSHRSQICRLINSLENKHFIAVKRSHGGLKQHNSYSVLKCGARYESGLHNRSQDTTSIRSKKEDKARARPAIEKGYAAGGGKASKNITAIAENAARYSKQEKFNALLRVGVDPDAASAIAKNTGITLESVTNAIRNGYAKEADSKGAFELKPGYIIAAIYKSISEGREIGLSRAAAARADEAAKACEFLKGSAISPAELEQLKKAQCELLEG